MHVFITKVAAIVISIVLLVGCNSSSVQKFSVYTGSEEIFLDESFIQRATVPGYCVDEVNSVILDSENKLPLCICDVVNFEVLVDYQFGQSIREKIFDEIYIKVYEKNKEYTTLVYQYNLEKTGGRMVLLSGDLSKVHDENITPSEEDYYKKVVNYFIKNRGIGNFSQIVTFYNYPTISCPNLRVILSQKPVSQD